jgi:O-antigen ligase
VRMREKITQGLGAAILGIAVLGVGGAPRPVLSVLCLLAAVALGFQITSRRTSRPSPLLFVTSFAAALTAVQLVPLPPGLAAAIDPIGQQLRVDGAVLLGEVPGWAPLSRDPAGTAYGLAYLLLLVGAALIGLRVAASERGRFLLVGAVVATGSLATLITALHTLTGATSLYGIYRPDFATPTLLGPLLNPNHLGCLFALTAVAAGGLVFHVKQPAALRAAWALGAVLSTAATLLTLSRGASLAMLAGGFVLAATLLGQKVRGRTEDAAPPRLTINSVAIGVVAVCGLALVVYSSGRGVSEQLRQTSGNEWNEPGSKYMAWRSASHLVAETPWLGIGRGAFESAFTRVHPSSGKITFSHPENEYVQAVVEWGLPGALLLAALVGWMAVAAARRWRLGPVTSAALGACTVVAVQSVVDFGLELPGIAIPTIALLASLVAVPLREFNPARRARYLGSRGFAVAVIGLAAMLPLADCTRRISDDHRTLVSTRPSTFDLARPMLARHPHDYLAFAYAGDAMGRTRDPRAMAFLNHALRLHPTHPGTHRAAARLLLAARRPHQAALEYATAMRGAAVVAPLLQEVVRALPDAELAAQAIPIDYPVPEHVVRVLVEAGAAPVALRWLRKVANLRPGAPRVGELLYAAALKADDLELAEHAARLRYRQDANAESLLALGQVLVKRDNLEAAASVLAAAATTPGRIDVVTAAWMLSCDVEVARKQWASARGCLLALRDAPQRGSAQLLEIARRLQRVDEASRATATP